MDPVHKQEEIGIEIETDYPAKVLFEVGIERIYGLQNSMTDQLRSMYALIEADKKLRDCAIVDEAVESIDRRINTRQQAALLMEKHILALGHCLEFIHAEMEKSEVKEEQPDFAALIKRMEAELEELDSRICLETDRVNDLTKTTRAQSEELLKVREDLDNDDKIMHTLEEKTKKCKKAIKETNAALHGNQVLLFRRLSRLEEQGRMRGWELTYEDLEAKRAEAEVEASLTGHPQIDSLTRLTAEHAIRLGVNEEVIAKVNGTVCAQSVSLMELHNKAAATRLDLAQLNDRTALEHEDLVGRVARLEESLGKVRCFAEVAPGETDPRSEEEHSDTDDGGEDSAQSTPGDCIPRGFVAEAARERDALRKQLNALEKEHSALTLRQDALDASFAIREKGMDAKFEELSEQRRAYKVSVNVVGTSIATFESDMTGINNALRKLKETATETNDRVNDMIERIKCLEEDKEDEEDEDEEDESDESTRERMSTRDSILVGMVSVALVMVVVLALISGTTTGILWLRVDQLQNSTSEIVYHHVNNTVVISEAAQIAITKALKLDKLAAESCETCRIMWKMMHAVSTPDFDCDEICDIGDHFAGIIRPTSDTKWAEYMRRLRCQHHGVC